MAGGAKMFSKIFKTEFVKNAKTFLIIISVVLGASIVTGLLSSLSSYISELYTSSGNDPLIRNDGIPAVVVWLTIASRMLTSVAFSAVYGGHIALVVVLFISFYKSVATDEAYLTFTLPASMEVQFFARLLVIIVWMAIFAVSLTLSASFLMMSAFNFSWAVDKVEIIDMIVEFFKYFTADTFFILSEVFLLMIAVSMFGIAEVVFAILLGNRITRRGKIGVAIGILFAIGFVLDIILIFGITFLTTVGFFNVSIHIILWFFIVLVAGLDVLMLFLSYRFLSKGLNVD